MLIALVVSAIALGVVGTLTVLWIARLLTAGGGSSRRSSRKGGTYGPYSGCWAAEWDTKPRVPLASGAASGRNIVGESFHQEALWSIVEGRDPEQETIVFEALVVPEPDNPFSPKKDAIAVCVPGFGPVGHFDSDQAAAYRELSTALLRMDVVGTVQAWLIGGFVMEDGSRAHLGAKVSLAGPKAVLKSLG